MEQLTKPEKIMLKQLKQVQKDYRNYVYLDYYSSFLVCSDEISSEKVNKLLQDDKTRFKLKIQPYFVNDVINELINKNLVKSIGIFGIGCYQVTYQGWFQREIIKMEQRELLLKNVLLPLIVSILGTITTLLLTSIVRIVLLP